jgi:EmrB/QacA subfamily drug resistance transporter
VLWVVGGYVLALAVLTVTAGRLGDVAGPRNVFLAGMAVFAVASALCGLAQSPWQLIGARLLQGVGAALIIPQTLTMMTLVFPPERRGRASAVWGVTAGLAGVAGPTLGGLLVSTAGWRSIFVVTLLVVPAGHARQARRLNGLGAALAGAGLGAITFGLLEGRHYGWGTVVSFVTVPMVIVAGFVLLAGFVVHQHRAREPLVPTRLFADRTFTVMTVSMAIVSMCVITLSLTMTLYLQSVLGMTAAQAGLTLAPWALGMTFGFPVTGRLVDRFGGERVLLGGLTVYAAALVCAGRESAGTCSWCRSRWPGCRSRRRSARSPRWRCGTSAPTWRGPRPGCSTRSARPARSSASPCWARCCRRGWTPSPRRPTGPPSATQSGSRCPGAPRA